MDKGHKTLGDPVKGLVKREGPGQVHGEPGKRLVSLKEILPLPKPRKIQAKLNKALFTCPLVCMFSLHSSHTAPRADPNVGPSAPLVADVKIGK